MKKQSIYKYFSSDEDAANTLKLAVNEFCGAFPDLSDDAKSLLKINRTLNRDEITTIKNNFLESIKEKLNSEIYASAKKLIDGVGKNTYNSLTFKLLNIIKCGYIEFADVLKEGYYYAEVSGGGCSCDYKKVYIDVDEVLNKNKNIEAMENKETILDVITKKIGDLVAQKLKNDDNLLNDVLTDIKDRLDGIDNLILDIEKDNSELANKVRDWKYEQINKSLETNKDKILKKIFKTKTITKEKVVYQSSYSSGCGRSNYGGC